RPAFHDVVAAEHFLSSALREEYAAHQKQNRELLHAAEHIPFSARALHRFAMSDLISQVMRAAFALVLVLGTAALVSTGSTSDVSKATPGPGHEMMLEKNSDGIAAYFATWLEKNVR